MRDRLDEAAPRFIGGDTLPQERGHRYLALGAAFTALSVGAAGAAFLGMSLLTSDPVVQPPEREIVESAMSGPPAIAEPSISEAFAAEIAAVPPVAAPPVAVSAAPEPVVALAAGDARFARDTPRARMLEGLDQETSPVRAFGNMTTPLKKIVEDAVGSPEPVQQQPDRQETAAVPVAPEKPPTSGRAPTGAAVMKADANIRSRPRKGAKVIGTVPDGTRVELVSCDGWCEIVVSGKRGFVWGEFVQRGPAVAKPVPATNEPQKPDVIPAAKVMPQTDTNRGR